MGTAQEPLVLWLVPEPGWAHPCPDLAHPCWEAAQHARILSPCHAGGAGDKQWWVAARRLRGGQGMVKHIGMNKVLMEQGLGVVNKH